MDVLYLRAPGCKHSQKLPVLSTLLRECSMEVSNKHVEKCTQGCAVSHTVICILCLRGECLLKEAGVGAPIITHSARAWYVTNKSCILNEKYFFDMLKQVFTQQMACMLIIMHVKKHLCVNESEWENRSFHWRQYANLYKTAYFYEKVTSTVMILRAHVKQNQMYTFIYTLPYMFQHIQIK